ncbi:MAG: lysostaphin resistance A-like protein [Acidimicrobiia bacterium]
MDGGRLDDDTRRALLTTGLIVGYGAIAPRVLPPSSVLPNLGAAAAGVLAARRWGRSWGDLGLDRGDAGPGLRAGLATVPPLASAVAAASLMPALRPLLRDERVIGLSGRDAAYHALVRIPVATALAEEVLFRGALLGMTGAGSRPVRAVAWTSVAFGLWHALPALHSHRSNPHGARLAERHGGVVVTVAGTVVVTAVAGAALAGLRLRARSVLAPVIAHAAVNGLVFLAARAVGGGVRRSGRS